MTVLVDAERGGDALVEVIDDGDDVAVAAVTVAELKVAVQLAKGRRRDKRERFVAAILDAVSSEPYAPQIPADLRVKDLPRPPDRLCAP